MKLRNFYLSLKDQLPWGRFFRNFLVNGNGWGLFSRHSHINRHTGRPKVVYPTPEAARQSAEGLSRKYGGRISAYKCMYCDGYHIGHDRN